MRAISRKITLSDNKAFQIRKDILPHFQDIWHFHDEIELVLILKSEGRRFIGDHIDQFNSGDLVLIGPNLPHLWQNPATYHEEGDNGGVEAIIIHFDPTFWGDRFLELEESRAIKNLLQNSKYGIKLEVADIKKITRKIERLLEVQGFERILLFFEILSGLAKNKKNILLASSGFVNSFKKSDDNRLDLIYEYVMKNLTGTIKLREASNLLNISDSAFCRFFKSKTRKTFSFFVKEARVGYACKLLQNKELTTSQICFECGFENFSYFSRSFKNITGITPTAYSNRYNFDKV